ncbi:ATP-binding protein [Wenxinia marina]|uniref:histidine kinase n=1 Tax=Wenxinia marina DSM 24838 TaxID=1123501 RepID=A0A0D0PZW4_9RHOB|nr:ATP-binding protein [Wenxinia marina]KIQ67904.1 Signal transduction histidine kinase [Wenxinia marina DSM 24838]
MTRRGHLRVSAARLGTGDFAWRIEEIAGRSGGRGTDSISLPMLTAGPSGTVLYMNEAFRRLTGARARSLDRIFRDLPLASGRMHVVEGADGPVSCLVAEIAGAGGRREVYLLPGATPAEAANPPPPLFQDLPLPLLRVTPTGELLDANEAGRAVVAASVAPGTRLPDLLDGLGRPIADWLRDVADGHSPGGPEFLRTTGPEERFIQVMLHPTGAGADRHLVAVLTDVTELKSLEAKFVQSQKMQAIGQLAGGVAHDFNNLLTAISGHCDLLLLRHDEEDPDYPDLIQVRQNSNRAASLVSQLLAFSRKQNMTSEIIDLRDALSDVGHLLNRLVGEKVRLTVRDEPDLPPVRADRRQIEQVLMNLVVNARDAMPDGGEVVIETADVTLSGPLRRDRATVPPGRWVRVRVVDEGIGIAPDKMPKIFEPFYTSKRMGEGTGLGLSTAYGIVKQSGGFIFADSEEGRGTTFTLYFPAQAWPVEVRPADLPQAPELPEATASGVILLVEDEAPVRAFASRALRLRGYSVLEADSGEAALEVLADPQNHVDIFVTDVIMPGKDGPTWVREALESRPDTSVVFVSGYAEDDFSAQRAAIPNSVFLPKPYSLADLCRTVHDRLPQTPGAPPD